MDEGYDRRKSFCCLGKICENQGNFMECIVIVVDNFSLHSIALIWSFQEYYESWHNSNWDEQCGLAGCNIIITESFMDESERQPWELFNNTHSFWYNLRTRSTWVIASTCTNDISSLVLHIATVVVPCWRYRCCDSGLTRCFTKLIAEFA